MTEAIRERIYSPCSGYAQGRLEFVLNFIDEDVDFVSYAPTDSFPCLGRQRGKAVVEASLRTIHTQFEFLKFQPILMVAQDPDVASIVKAKLKQLRRDVSCNSCSPSFYDFEMGGR